MRKRFTLLVSVLCVSLTLVASGCISSNNQPTPIPLTPQQVLDGYKNAELLTMSALATAHAFGGLSDADWTAAQTADAAADVAEQAVQDAITSGKTVDFNTLLQAYIKAIGGVDNIAAKNKVAIVRAPADVASAVRFRR